MASQLQAYLRDHRGSIFLFSILSGLHLILELLNLPTEDWLIQWYTAVDISRGIGMYDQTFRVVGGRWINVAYHFPVFFYVLAVVISVFGMHQVVGRIFLWISTNILGMLFLILIDFKSEQQLRLYFLLYFLNPYLLGISLLGLFDQFTFIFIIGTLLAIKHDYYFLGGFLTGLGIMTKFYPGLVMVPIVMYLLREHEFQKLSIFIVGVLIPVVMIFWYFWYNFGMVFLERTILWQSSRNTISLSVWWYLQSPHQLVLSLITAVFLTTILIYYLLKSDEIDLYLYLSFLFVIFILSLRSLYPQYGFWFSIIILPTLFRHSSFTKTYFLLVDNVLFALGSLMWSLEFALTHQQYDYKSLLPQWVGYADGFMIIGTVLVYISLLLHLLPMFQVFSRLSPPANPEGSL